MKSKKNPVLIIPAGWQYNAKEMRVVNTLHRYIKEDITFFAAGKSQRPQGARYTDWRPIMGDKMP